MKIIGHTLYQVPPRWLFLKIETDEGITGWGEPVIEGRASTVKGAVDELMEYLQGKNPLNIEDHWNVLYRAGFYRGGPILMSALAATADASTRRCGTSKENITTLPSMSCLAEKLEVK